MVRYPLAGNIAIASGIGCVGDVIAQTIEERESIDLNRTMRVAFWGFISAGPVFLWLRKLEVLIGGSTLKQTLKKVALHQAVASPIHNAAFYGFTGLWIQREAAEETEGKPPETSFQAWFDQWNKKLRDEMIETQITANMIWFPANMIAFMFLPLRYRVPYQSALGSVWMAYLSFIGHRKKSPGGSA